MEKDSILSVTGGDFIDTIHNAELAIVPFGSIEYHGPHAPLGTDSFIAKELACRIGKRMNAIVFPLIAFTACPSSTHRFPGTLHIDSDVMTAYLESVFQGLFRNNVKKILALNAHDGNIDTVKRATDQLVIEHPDCCILLINWWQALPEAEIESLGLFSQGGGHGHGGPLETSAAWAVQTDSVDLSKADDIELDFKGLPSNWPGYSGRISESSIEKGLILLRMAENAIIDTVQEWLVKGK